mgnify:CR=1 FL=1|tara:strand:+ start:95 stop:718 length:624 start_codon:yes stop_codon:yes gene_type:complete
MENLNIDIAETTEQIDALQTELAERKREIEREERRLRAEEAARKQREIDEKHQFKASTIEADISEQLGEELLARMEDCGTRMACYAETSGRWLPMYTGKYFLHVTSWDYGERPRKYKVTNGKLSEAGVKFITDCCNSYDRKIERKQERENYLEASGINDCRSIREQHFRLNFQHWSEEPTKVLTINRLPVEQMRQVVDLVNSFSEEA